MYNERIRSFLKQFEPARDNVMTDIEKTCRERGLEPVPPEVGAFLGLIVKASKCRHILEIGTCLGYSTIWMAKNLLPDGRIETIEIDKGLIQEAEKNFKRAGIAERIKILHGAALNILPRLKQDYDLVFIDALKTEYPQYLEKSLPLLRAGGIILADDVLLGQLGWGDEATTEALHKFNQMICSELKGILLPIGDGLAFAVK